MAICASLLARHRLAHEHHRPFLSCIVTGDEKWCLYANTRKRKEWLSPIKNNSPYKDLRASTKDNVMHLRERRIASPRCNHHCWHLLPTTETSCRCNPRKRQTGLRKLCYSTITPSSTLETWQKQELYRSSVGKSFRTHLIHLILRPQFSPFPLSIEQPSRNLLSGKCALTSTQNHAISTGAESKNYSSVRKNVVNSEGEYIVDD